MAILSPRGSFSIEYAVLIVVLASAVVGMSVYMKRAISGRWRQSADTFGQGRQFEPGVTK
jgi:Flp pilus assembly pilin Flp